MSAKTLQMKATEIVDGVKQSVNAYPITTPDRVVDSIGVSVDTKISNLSSLTTVDNNTIIRDNGMLKVNTVNTPLQDNTQPITSGGVYTAIGNIESLLHTI